jgi:cation diffusion facilitator CzcD-associated flavoprotein CzcO
MTYARMHFLPTPKDFVGPDLGMRALSYREWLDAIEGEGTERLDRVPTESWMCYLRWYRSVLKLPVRNETRITLVEPAPNDLLRLMLDRAGVAEAMHCRMLVRATGILGSGGRAIPVFIKEAIPADCFAHTSDHIDFDKWKGQRVAVIGVGASAFDNAATALE